LAGEHGYTDIDELEDDPVSIDKCLDLIDYVADVGFYRRDRRFDLPPTNQTVCHG
jgi:hypothetical protein